MSADATYIPSDEEIYRQVDVKIASFAGLFERTGRPPMDRERMFREQKQWYVDADKRAAAKQAAAEAQAKLDAEADAAYIRMREQQGKPILVQSELAHQYPECDRFKEGVRLSQRELHELADRWQLMTSAKVLRQRVRAFETQTRKKLFTILADAYALYRAICNSEQALSVFDELRSVLKTIDGVTTHYDTPTATVLLKFLFKDAKDKTLLSYSRSFVLAYNYEIEPKSFQAFVDEMGGLEKIRHAFAKVAKADAGVLHTDGKQADRAASYQMLWRLPVVARVQLDSSNRHRFSNDDRGYCLVLAHKDPLDQLELQLQIPVTEQLERLIFDYITESAKRAGHKPWFDIRRDEERHLADKKSKQLLKRYEAVKKAAENKAKCEARIAKANAEFQGKIVADRKRAEKAAEKARKSKSGAKKAAQSKS